ncbi:MAG TPA: ABC transporter permease [Blastocatellia bacterium]|nr:ABC transporter permease [Blastocatellia bacterium]
MQALLQDLRYGVRMLVKRPGFTLIAMTTLALGIGANTAIFSIVNTVLLRSLPYPESEKIVMLWQGGQRGEQGHLQVSPPELMDYRAQQQVFQHLAAHTIADANLSGSGEPERLRAAVVSADWFTVLRTQPLQGRTFLTEEHQPGQNNSVVLSYGLWQRRFGGDTNVIGRSIVLNGRARTIVAVMPNGFRFPAEADLWLPLALTPEQLSPNQRARHYLNVIARIKDGVTLAQAEERVRAIANGFPGGLDARLIALQDELVGPVKAPLYVLFGAVIFVLLIACANVGNLLLARSSARRPEMAIRQALGASRIRLLRQMLTESLLLALIGGALGILLAWWGKDSLIALTSDVIPRADEINLNIGVMGFALALSLLTGILFGLAPALQSSRLNLNEMLKLGAQSVNSGSGQRLRSFMVVFQIATAIVLLVGAGLLLRSFYRLSQVNPGFKPEQVLTADLSLPFSRYDTDAKRADFYQRLVPQLAALPGVQSAGIISDLPLSGMNADRSYTHEAIPPDRQRRSPPNADFRHCSADYFNAIGIPLLTGRTFTEQDAANSQPVAIVNEALANRIWPNENAVGKRIAFLAPQGLEPWRVIVGVVGNVKHRGLNTDVRPEIYVPHAQAPIGTMTLVLRTAGDPMAMAATIRKTVQSLDAEQPLFNIRALDRLRNESIAPQRFILMLLGLFAVVALFLSGLGIFGVITYTVNQRTRELGIRMALGAQASDILRLVVRQGMKLVIVGIVIGLGCALAVSRLIKALLFGIGPSDPITFIAVASILAAVAALACWIPARRATNVDPLIALRYE